MNKAKKALMFLFVELMIVFRRFGLFIKITSGTANGFTYGSYDLESEVELAKSFLIDDAVVIDGGANVGEWSQMLLAKCQGNISKLIMIEPNIYHKGTHSLLHKNYPNIALTEWVALGCESGTMDLHFDKEGSGLASLYDRKIDYHGIKLAKKIKVKITTLLNLCEKHHIYQIDFLKLDLEGHELAALQGVEPLIANHSIRALTFEFGGCNIDSRTFFRDFWEFLNVSHGYTLYRLIPGKRLLRIDNYSEREEQFCWQNLLACAPGINPAWAIVVNG
jgi:FkbM family methyltransferase